MSRVTPSTDIRICWLTVVALGICGVLSGRVQGQTVGVPPTYGAAPYSPAPYGTASPGFPTAPAPAATLGPGIQPFDPYALPPGTGSTPVPMTGSFGVRRYRRRRRPRLGRRRASRIRQLRIPPRRHRCLGAGLHAATGDRDALWRPGATPFGATPYAGAAQPVAPPPYQRLFTKTGGRYTWVSGSGEGDEMQTNDLELSTTLNCVSFFGNAGGLRIVPGFVFTWLDGPSPPVTADMPPDLYAAYVDFGWYPVFSPQISGEVNFRPGVYSDFNTVTTDSIRLIGSGVGIIKLGPTSSLKLGAVYIDRADVKLLPAFGILWTPNAQTRWDIFFPSPKLAHYWKTINNRQLWWYVGAEYGGGSWTMRRAEAPDQGASERVDINDYRVYLGAECSNLNRMYSFFEVGYVFNRELFYVVVPSDRTSLSDAVMLRAGIAF